MDAFEGWVMLVELVVLIADVAWMGFLIGHMSGERAMHQWLREGVRDE